MNGTLEFFPQRPRLFRRDARDEDALFTFQKFAGDFQNLRGSFSRAENDFWKSLPQTAVRVHLRETEVGNRRGLECAQRLITADFAGAELVEQMAGLGGCHSRTMPQSGGIVTL
jgi:hypothetical protein